jgi:DNA-binding beta-propeller fold protein YncE
MPSVATRARAWSFLMLFVWAPLAGAQTMEIYAGGRLFSNDPATEIQVTPHSITRAPDGFLYLADWNGPLLRFDPAAATVWALPGIQGRANFLFGGIEGLAAHPNGQLHGANEFLLYWINNSGGVMTQIGTLQSGGPMVYGADGTLYYASWQDNRVRARLPSGTIVVLAGTGTAGFSGDGGAATLAQLSNPAGVALDLAGNLYVIDNGNHRIRRINRTTGVINTVAGTGSFGFNGAGLPALQTNFGYPTAITVDAGGNLIIAAESRIHSVDAASGIVTHLAGTGYSSTSTGDGGPATSASFTYVGKMTFDAAGRLYAIDSFRVRRIDLASGTITTAIGNGDSAFCGEGCCSRPT